MPGVFGDAEYESQKRQQQEQALGHSAKLRKQWLDDAAILLHAEKAQHAEAFSGLLGDAVEAVNTAVMQSRDYAEGLVQGAAFDPEALKTVWENAHARLSDIKAYLGTQSPVPHERKIVLRDSIDALQAAIAAAFEIEDVQRGR